MEITKAKSGDIEALLPIFAKARQLMIDSGNPDQWSSDYPSRELLERDVAKGELYVIRLEGQIVGGFVFADGPEPVYNGLEGTWLNEAPYKVIHRIAAPEAKGAGRFVFNWAMEQTDSLRIDTHADNAIMRRILEREGFTFVGEMSLPNGSRRRGYHRVND